MSQSGEYVDKQLRYHSNFCFCYTSRSAGWASNSAFFVIVVEIIWSCKKKKEPSNFAYVLNFKREAMDHSSIVKDSLLSVRIDCVVYDLYTCGKGNKDGNTSFMGFLMLFEILKL